MAEFTAVIPLLNATCTLIPKVPIFLDERISVRGFTPEHIVAIQARRKTAAQHVHPGAKCILLASGNAEASIQEIERLSLHATFILNFFAKAGTVNCGPCFSIKHVRTHSVSKIFKSAPLSYDYSPTYSIDPTTDPLKIKSLYEGIQSAVDKERGLNLSLHRFNSALSRIELHDRLIDMSICLESIFNAQTEISFRFALYNSLLAEDDPKERYTLFLLLKRLYKERSNAVHGNTAADSTWINANWPTIIKIAKLALLKKIDYLSGAQTDSWQTHLDKLALGE